MMLKRLWNEEYVEQAGKGMQPNEILISLTETDEACETSMRETDEACETSMRVI